jgi:hypothetical protein
MVHIALIIMIYFLMPILFPTYMPISERSSDTQGHYVGLGFGVELRSVLLQARSNGLGLP